MLNYTEIYQWLINLIYVLIPLCIIMTIMFGIDTMTGIIKAVRNKEFKSSELKRAIPKFLMYNGFVIIAICIDFILMFYAHLQSDVLNEHIIKILSTYVVTKLCKIFIIIVEITSVFENAKDMGYPIPKFMIDILEKLSKYLDYTEETEDINPVNTDTFTIEELQKLLDESGDNNEF